MSQNFVAVDREQGFLLPPDVREWLPEGHLAWLVLDAVAEMDLAVFYAAYRRDGWGRPAYDPAMMVALLLYSYARAERSSRGIERRCGEDVAYRVISANRVPDHSTLARFRRDHERALAGLFTEVLVLCAKAGLVNVGLIAVDGTKVHANASDRSNLGYEQIAREILAEAEETDREEDERYGEQRGDELPPEFRVSGDRRKRLQEARRLLDAERAARESEVPQARSERLKQAERRLREDHELERQVNAEYEAWRAQGISADGRRFGGRDPDRYPVPATPRGIANVTDPQSRKVKTPRYMQGYNAQAVTTREQIVIAADVNIDSSDAGHLKPMITAACDELQAAGITQQTRRRGRRCRLLEERRHRARRQPRHTDAGLPRGAQTQHPQTRARRRPLRVHAPRPGDRRRPRALQTTPSDDRTGLRAHQAQPTRRPLPTARQIRLPLRMATNHRHPQPPGMKLRGGSSGGGVRARG
jgi:transposase